MPQNRRAFSTVKLSINGKARRDSGVSRMVPSPPPSKTVKPFPKTNSSIGKVKSLTSILTSTIESRAVPPPTQAFKSALRKTPRDTLPGINAISTTASSGSAESTTNMAAVSSPSAVLSPRFPELGRITPSPSPNLPHSRALPRLRTGIITSFAAAAIVSRSTSMAPTSRPSRTTRKTKLISADSSQSKFTAEPAPPKFNSAISP